MAYAVVHHFAGGTKEQYEASIAAVHPSDGSLPEGQIFHAAGPSTGGWISLAHQVFYPDFYGGVWSLCRRPASRARRPGRPG